MSEITRTAIGAPFEVAMCSELSRRQFHSIAQALLIERDQLKSEIAGLKTGYQAYEQVNAELKAEVEGLRKDAERYRFLRNGLDGLDLSCADTMEEIDALIDVAIGKGEQS